MGVLRNCRAAVRRFAGSVPPDRLDETRSAFSRIYERDTWGLTTDEYVTDRPGLEPDSERRSRLENLIIALIRLNDIRTVVEFGCGYLSFPKSVFDGVKYTGFDVVPSVIADNEAKHGDDDFSFRTVVDGVTIPKADMLICKDVFQHLPTADVLHYLPLFRSNFRLLLIGNDVSPADNLNGDTKRGGYRALRLDLPPFNTPNVVLQKWESVDFGVRIVKWFCLVVGCPGEGADGVTLRSA